MSLVNMNDMMNKAQDGQYALGAFNILDYNSTKAVVDAAVELNSSVIIQTSAKTVLFWGAEAIMSWMHQLCESAPVDIAVHLDHCKDIDLIQQCIDAGWTSVMIDASSMPFEENIRLSRQVVEMARPKGVSIEAELGAIVGVEDDIHVKEQDAHLADPTQSVEFCQTVQPDVFAPAIGTAHGIYHGEPKVAFDLIEQIRGDVGLPLALHGGTGLSEDVFKQSIGLGCTKVNISTELKYAFIDSVADYHQQKPDDYNPLNIIGAQYKALKEAVVKDIKLFGKAGVSFQK